MSTDLLVLGLVVVLLAMTGSNQGADQGMPGLPQLVIPAAFLVCGAFGLHGVRLRWLGLAFASALLLNGGVIPNRQFLTTLTVFSGLGLIGIAFLEKKPMAGGNRLILAISLVAASFLIVYAFGMLI